MFNSRIFYSPERVIKQNLPQKAKVIGQNFVDLKALLDDEEDRRVREGELKTECTELKTKYADLRNKNVASRKEIKEIKMKLATLREQNDHLVWTNKQQRKRMEQIQKESAEIMQKHNAVKRASFAKNIVIAGMIAAAIPGVIRIGKELNAKLSESK